MSKIKIQGNASGTGVLTIEAPNTNTDRTITLPDSSVTLGAATPSITDNGNATAITIDSSENVEFTNTIKVAGSSSGSSKVVVANSTATENWIYIGSSQLHFRTQADTANRFTLTNDGRGLSQFTAKVWCLFDGNGSIHDSHNITSVDDDGTGLNELHFTNALGNIKFSCVTSSGRYTSDTDRLLRAMTESNTRLRTTSSIAFHISYSDSTNQDGLYASALIFGD